MSFVELRRAPVIIAPRIEVSDHEREVAERNERTPGKIERRWKALSGDPEVMGAPGG